MNPFNTVAIVPRLAYNADVTLDPSDIRAIDVKHMRYRLL